MQGEISDAKSSVTELENDLKDTNDRFNDYAREDTVIERFNSVEQKITSNEASINVVNEIIENGITKVKTTQGYTFDDDGLSIDNTNSKTKGMDITDKSTGESVLFAGYDETSQETIVKTKNLTVNKYLNIPHARFEKFKNSKFGEGTGCFWID